MKQQNYSIVWEDEHLVVVNKAAGVLCIPGRFDDPSMNLKAYLEKKYESIWVVHRIDRYTSGLVCFAKSEEAHALLSNMFSKHIPQKKYLAISTGQFIRKEGFIDYSIKENPSKRGSMMVSAKGKTAYSSYRVLESFLSHTLVEVSIKTGRTHQIRVHLKSIGHPVLADPIYSASEAFMLSSVKGKKFRKAKGAKEQPLLRRTALHSFQLTFNHPIEEKELNFEAPLPKDMRAVLNQLRKWNM